MSSITGRSWIITHTKNGVYLSYNLFSSNGFNIDECHYTSDAAIVYAYIHLKSSISLQALRLFLHRSNTITLFEIFGYDSVALVRAHHDPLDHIGVRILLHHFRTGNDLLVACTDGEPGITRGFFWDCGSFTRLKDALSKKHKRLIPFVYEIERELVEGRQKDSTIELLQAQVASNESRISDQQVFIQELQQYEFVCHVIRHRLKEMDKSIKDVLLAPDHRGLPLMPHFFG